MSTLKQVSELLKAHQDMTRGQQSTTGKPITRLKNSDTNPPTIRPAPALPEEHCDTAVVEDNTDSRKDKELQETSIIPQCTVAPTKGTHDVAKEDHTQPGRILVRMEDKGKPDDGNPPMLSMCTDH